MKNEPIFSCTSEDGIDTITYEHSGESAVFTVYKDESDRYALRLVSSTISTGNLIKSNVKLESIKKRMLRWYVFSYLKPIESGVKVEINMKTGDSNVIGFTNGSMSAYPGEHANYDWDDDWTASKKICPNCNNVWMWQAGWYDGSRESGGACIGTQYHCGNCNHHESH